MLARASARARARECDLRGRLICILSSARCPRRSVRTCACERPCARARTRVYACVRASAYTQAGARSCARVGA
eukprot:190093-Pleurochrysis_carterae.AAC.2